MTVTEPESHLAYARAIAHLLIQIHDPLPSRVDTELLLDGLGCIANHLDALTDTEKESNQRERHYH